MCAAEPKRLDGDAALPSDLEVYLLLSQCRSSR
jgi:hypothetical protein